MNIDCKLCVPPKRLKLSSFINHLSSWHPKPPSDFTIVCPAQHCKDSNFNTVSALKAHWYRNHHLFKRSVPATKQCLTSTQVEEMVCESGSSTCDDAPESDSFSVTDREDIGNDCDFEVSVCDDEPLRVSETAEEDCSSEREVLDLSTDSSIAENCFVEECSDEEIDFEEDAVTESCEEVPVSVLIEEDQQKDSNLLKFEAAKFVLKLKTTFGVTESALEDILDGASELLQLVLMSYASEVDDLIKSQGSISTDQLRNGAFKASGILSDFKTKSKRNSYLAKHFHKLPVSRHVVGVYGKRQGAGDKRRTVIVKDQVMYVSIANSLLALSQHRDFGTLLSHENVSPDTNLIDSHLKSTCFTRNQFFANNPHAFRIILYFDEVEICNVLGAMAGKHKLGCVYYVLDNIPLKHRSNLKLIHLAAMFNSNFIKKHVNGMDAVLKPVVDELKRLEEGVKCSDGKILKAALVAITGDNLGLHQVGGFKEGFTAEHPCRICLATYEQIKSMIEEDPSLFRTRQNYSEQVAQVKKAGDAKSVEFGINRNPIVNSLKNFHVVDGLPPDGHHDILQGVLALTLKKLLANLIQKNIITLRKLNDIMLNSFDYGYTYTKPSEIKSDHLQPEGNLRQSATQMWHLGVLLPLFIGNDVPEDCPEWENFIQLLEICRIIFSPAISCGMLDQLASLIYQYLSSFIKCYGDLTPKQHHLLHYPHLIKKFGPPVFFWAMRMEAKHKLFKKLIGVIGNYKNPTWTLSNIHEWRMAVCRSESLLPVNQCGPLQTVSVSNLPYANVVIGTETVKLTKWALHDRILFKSGGVCYVVLGTDSSFYPVFGLVHHLIVWPEFRLVCRKVKTELYDTHISAFQVEVSDDFIIIQPKHVLGHSVFHSHFHHGRNFIPMKYSIRGSL